MSLNTSTTPQTGRTYGGLSSEQRRAQRKQQFLEAGLELFGTIGYRTTTVRAICKQAKLTDRYFYEAFGSLEKLVMAVYEHCMTGISKRIIASITATYQGDNSAEALAAGLEVFFKELEEPKIARICMTELEGISPEVNALYNAYIQSFSKIILQLAAKAYPDWQVSHAQREVMGISLIGALRQSATHWCATGYAIPREDMVAGTLRIFVGLIESLEQQELSNN